MTNFQGLASSTLIGSMPHKDRRKAVELVLKTVPQIPAWPQLPAYPAEQMMAQYVEGLPGFVEEQGRCFVRMDAGDFEQKVYEFYEDYLALEEAPEGIGDSRFGLSPVTGASLRVFLDALPGAAAPFRALKAQVSGPFTLLSGLKDQEGRSLIFDDQFLDIVPKLLGLKARWLIEQLRPFGVPIIIFLDEPGLAGFGSSAFITISGELVRRLLGEAVEAVHAGGALAGIHVCANTDWQLAFQSGFDIINFDAYTYFDKFLIYRTECLDFILKGGNLAWGIVPTLDPQAIETETVESLTQRFQEQLASLASPEVPAGKILSQSILTPSCGCGSLSESATERVFDLLTGVQKRAAAI